MSEQVEIATAASREMIDEAARYLWTHKIPASTEERKQGMYVLLVSRKYEAVANVAVNNYINSKTDLEVE